MIVTPLLKSRKENPVGPQTLVRADVLLNMLSDGALPNHPLGGLIIMYSPEYKTNNHRPLGIPPYNTTSRRLPNHVLGLGSGG